VDHEFLRGMNRLVDLKDLAAALPKEFPTGVKPRPGWEKFEDWLTALLAGAEKETVVGAAAGAALCDRATARNVPRLIRTARVVSAALDIPTMVSIRQAAESWIFMDPSKNSIPRQGQKSSQSC
jgi:hypothetical protein